jgi:ribosomal protein S12 methylthiotransferase accessory factor
MTIKIKSKEPFNMEMKITFPGGKKVHAEFDSLTVETDQPVKVGGEGSAPAPYQIFLASIGTCAGIYVLSFCQERKISTEGVSLTQSMHWGMTPDGKSRLQKITIGIIVPEGFPEKYVKAIERVASGCAVKKTLLDPPEFEVRAAHAG